VFSGSQSCAGAQAGLHSCTGVGYHSFTGVGEQCRAGSNNLYETGSHSLVCDWFSQLGIGLVLIAVKTA